MKEKPTFIVIGGMGPEAGQLLYSKLLAKMRTFYQSDQDFPESLLLSLNQVPDRTEFLENPTTTANPGKIYAEKIFDFVNGFDAPELLIACNTFHHENIIGPFCRMLPHKACVHPMNTRLVSHLKTMGVKKIGMLSTLGTYKHGIYSQPLEAAGMSIVNPKNPQTVHDLIYRPNGIKAGGNHQSLRAELQEFMDELISNGAETIILGCTELPLVFEGTNYLNIPVLDPMQVLIDTLTIREVP
jgi:aspartate racemase